MSEHEIIPYDPDAGSDTGHGGDVSTDSGHGGDVSTDSTNNRDGSNPDASTQDARTDQSLVDGTVVDSSSADSGAGGPDVPDAGRPDVASPDVASQDVIDAALADVRIDGSVDAVADRDATKQDVGSDSSGADADATSTDAVPVDAPVVCESGGPGCGLPCVDLTSDSHNCGACGHDCQGGVCSGGHCQPVLLVPQVNPIDLFQDGASLYWGWSSAAQMGPAVQMGGKSPPANPIAISPTLSDSVLSVRAAGTQFYWTSNSGVFGCPVTGCTTGNMVTYSSTAAYGLAVDSANIYSSTNLSAGSVYSCSLGGCNGSPTVLASNLSFPEHLAIDANNIYWANTNGGSAGGSIMSCAKTGCSQTPTVLAPNHTALAVAVDNTSVYWADYQGGTLYSCAVGGCAMTPTQLATGPTAARTIAVDATHVYWGTYDSLMRCPLAGCPGGTPEVVLTTSFLQSIALDATAIYFGTMDGIQKLAK